MKAVLLTSIAFAALTAAALGSTEASARDVPASIAFFYDALNAAPGKDVGGLLAQATTSGWLSCSGNDVCVGREQVAAAIAGRHKSIPNLKWEIKEVLVSRDRLVVRGEASGTPAGDLFGVPYSGKSFKLMSIDIHTMDAGKIAHSYHVEDWMGAAHQLSAPELAR